MIEDSMLKIMWKKYANECFLSNRHVFCEMKKLKRLELPEEKVVTPNEKSIFP